MSARTRLRAALGSTAVVALATFARADAPSDQYNLFNQNNAVIVDLRTGLSWQRYPPAFFRTFDAAAVYCDQLSLGGLTSGWRVPSYKELLTIVDESPHVEYDGVQDVEKYIDGNAFPGAAVAASPYWTSSPYPGTPAGQAYTVSFHNGVPQPNDMGFSAYVRCVH